MTLKREQTRRSGRGHRILLAAATCLVTLAGASPAAAQTCLAAPGTSAVDQYCETFPAAGGSRRSEQKGGEQLRSTLAPGVERALTGAGNDGRRLLAIPAAKSGAKPAGKPGGAAQTGNGAFPAPSSNPLKAVTSASRSGTAVSDLWMWILAGVAVALVALALLRRRRAHGAEPPTT